MTERMIMRGQGCHYATGGECRLRHAEHGIPRCGVHKQQVQPVTHAQPVQASGDDLSRERGVGRAVQVEHSTAVGMGQRADPVPGRFRGQAAGHLSAPAQDDQPVRGPDELQRTRVKTGARQRWGDDVIEEGGGGAQRSRTGAQHTRVA